MKLIFYHGTSEENAKRIEKEGFVPDKKYNWKVKSKKGFVYLSVAYAPFYAMKHYTEKLALIKVEVDTKDCYPEDDYIMAMKGRAFYTQKELDTVNIEDYKVLWEKSLKYLGNVAVKPEKIKIIGIRYFNGRKLVLKCDPSITPLNFIVMGEYYKKLSAWIYEGKDFMEFPNFMEMGK
jgi:hypothetical protein